MGSNLIDLDACRDHVPADVTSIQLQVNFQAGVGTLRLGQVTL